LRNFFCVVTGPHIDIWAGVCSKLLGAVTMLSFIHVFEIRLSTYGLTMTCGFLIALLLLRFQAKRFQIPYRRLFILSVYSCAVAFLCAHLANLVVYGERLTLLRIVDISNGHMFYGFFFGALLGSFIVTRIYRMPYIQTLNICIPAWATAQVFGRIGCFFAGCCYGQPSSLPWAVTFHGPECAAPLGVSLHPTQLYEATAMTLDVVALFIIQRNARFQPYLVFIYAFCYASVRLVEDFFRGDTPPSIFGVFTVSQTVSAMILLVLLVGFLVHRLRPR
jgi:phosphatidylglycerol:prolipoprotein diacylglycerol transferase